MIFIWRGFGIVVPIIFFLSGWITSYWFKDTRLLNASYIGWTMLWAGLALIFFALASFGAKLDENGQPTDKKVYNDFFWIPTWVWSLGFIVGSIYFINKTDPETTSSNLVDLQSDLGSTTSAGEEREETNERRLYLYNCAADSMKIEIRETKPADGTYFDFYVQDNDYEFVVIEPDKYTVKMDDYEQKINLREKSKNHKNDYDGAWLVLCAEIDLVLVEVTDICTENVTAADLSKTKWKDKVIKRYNGDDLIEPNLKSEGGGEIQVVAPGYYIPKEHGSRERVYTLIPIDRSLDVTEELLLKKITNITEL